MNMRKTVVIAAAGILFFGWLTSLFVEHECSITSQGARMVSDNEINLTGTSDCPDGPISVNAMGEDHILELKNGIFGARIILDGDKVVSVTDFRG